MSNDTLACFNAHAKQTGRAPTLIAPAPDIDFTPHLAELEASGLSEAQRTQFLSVLVPILWHFVDLGFRGDISELFLSNKDSEAVHLPCSTNKETPLKGEKDAAAP